MKLGCFIRAWDSLQVELQGWYSLSRFRAVDDHSTNSSSLRDVLILLFVPVPCFLLVIGIDLLPVSSPELGFVHQSAGLHFRFWFMGALLSFAGAIQIEVGLMLLSLPPKNHLAICVAGGMATAMNSVIFGLTIGFPIPFTPVLATAPWLVSLCGGLYLTWRHELKTNKEARNNIIRYSIIMSSQVALFFAYTSYGVVFSTTRSEYQTYVSFCLPFIKLFLKNVLNKGVFHMEDLAPTIVVFNVGLFHSLFMSITTQQARTSGSVVFLMIVDVVQNIIAVYEVVSVMNRIRINVDILSSMGKTSDASVEPSRLRHLGVIEYSWSLLQTNPHIADHPHLTSPRHAHPDVDRISTLQTIARNIGAIGRSPMTLSFSRIHPVVPNEFPLHRRSSLKSLSQVDRVRVCIIRDTQKLLHMVEFYVLTEFCEVMTAVVYTLYILTMTYLPTRTYYTSLARLTDQEMLTTVVQVAKYAGFEFMSFVAVCFVMDRLLKWRVPTYRQAAFAVLSNMKMTQATIVMWVFFVVQLNFEHYGMDFTFKFKWLRRKDYPSG